MLLSLDLNNSVKDRYFLPFNTCMRVGVGTKLFLMMKKFYFIFILQKYLLIATNY